MTDTELSPLRAGRITGSRIPAVLGVSTYQDADGVLREMVRQYFGAPAEFTGNIATDWGREHEDDAIDYYERDRGVLVHAAQEFLIHPEHDWLGVSPDGRVGLVGESGMVEAKCPLWRRYTQWQECPDIAAQMRLQQECADASWTDLVVWRPNYSVISRLDRDPSWLPLVLDTLKRFYDRYQTTIADPRLYEPLLEPLVDERTDPVWQEAAAAFLDRRADRIYAELAEADAKQRLIELADGKRKVRGCGVRLTTYFRRGNVNNQALYAAHGLDDSVLNAYRGAGRYVTSVAAMVEKEK